jgi:hypothetical protein
MADFCMGLWGAESDRRVAEVDARHRVNMARLEQEEQETIARIERESQASEMSRMIAKYNKVVADYKVLGDAYDEVVAARDTFREVLKENLDSLNITKDEINERVHAAVSAKKALA